LTAGGLDQAGRTVWCEWLFGLEDGLGRDGEKDSESSASTGRVGCLNLAVVGDDDRFGDRQAQSGSAPSTSPAALRSPEAIEYPVERIGWKSWAVIEDLEHREPAVATRGQFDRRPVGRVDQRVPCQVGEDLAQLVGIREHGQRTLAVNPHLPRRSHRTSVIGRVLG
jgi:hypothetical protein